MPLPRSAYTENAIMRARDRALDWLRGQGMGSGYPRSWGQEAVRDERNGYTLYDDADEAPPVAGYEQLAEEGLAVLVGPSMAGRLHYQLVTPKEANNG